MTLPFLSRSRLRPRAGTPPVPQSPSDIALSANTIADNAASGTDIGTLSATDSDSSSWTWTIVSQPSGNPFALSGSNPAATIVLERSGTGTLTAGDKTVRIRADDGSSTPYEEDLTVTVSDSGSDVLIETVTVDNFSGASRDNPTITIARDFVEGAVPTGTKVDIRYSSSSLSLQQADQRAYHGDGSLKRAVFAFKPTATYADAGNLAFDFYKTSGSFSNSTSISISTLTAQNFQMRIKVGGTNYYCVLNNLISAGTYRTVAQGTAKLGIEAYGIFRAGTGASDTDHGQFQGVFWADIRSDGSIEVMAVAVNGRVANGSAATVDEAELLNGATSLRLYTTDFTWYAHNALWFCDDDYLPYCTGGAENFWPRTSFTYMHDRKLTWHVTNNATRNGLISVPTPENYAPNSYGPFESGGINQGGPHKWIGHVTTEAARLLSVNVDTGISAANRKAFLKDDRANTIAGQVWFYAWFVRHETGLPPVLVNQDYTASGLTSAQPSIGWQTSATITDSGGTFSPDGGSSPAAIDSSHQPNYGYVQWAVTGRPWWSWMQIVHNIGMLGAENPDTGATYTRRPTINGNAYDCTAWQQVQMRQICWKLRGISQMHWTLADNHPCKAYMGQLLTNSWATSAEFLNTPFCSAPGVGQYYLPYLTDPDGLGYDVGWSNFQASYLAAQIALCVHRGQLSSSHVTVTEFLAKGLFGVHKACFYWSAGAYAFSYRSGSGADNTDPIVQNDWSDGYFATNSGVYTAMTEKLISDAGGVSGSCPASGTAVGFFSSGSHSYPQLCRGALDVCDLVGIGSVSAVLTKANAANAAAGITDANWAADYLQWDIRRP